MQKPSYWVLYIAMLSLGMGQTIIFAVMPMLGRQLGLHEMLWTIPFLDISFMPKEFAITSLSAVTALTFSIVSPWWGRLSDTHGRKKIIITGLFGYTFGMSLFCLAAASGLYGVVGGMALFALLFITRITHAAVMSAAIPAGNAYVIDVNEPAQRSKSLSRVSAAMQIGTLCGPALVALLVFHYLAPFMFQALLTAVVGVILLLFLPDTKVQPFTGKRQKLRYLDTRYRSLLFVSALVYTAFGMVQQTLGFYFQDLLKLSDTDAAYWFSISMIASSSAMLFSQLVLVKILNLTAKQFILLGLPFLAIGFAILAMATSLPVLILSMAMFGLAMGLIGPNLSAAASMTIEAHEQGALAGLMGAMAGVGFVIGPLLGGFLYGFGIYLPYAMAALIAAAALVFFITKLRK